MQTSTLFKKIQLVTILSVILLGAILLFYSKGSTKNSSSLSRASISLIDSQAKDNRKLPARLSIPKINVDADIEYVSAKDNGEMEAPKSFFNVAWYSLGKAPGETGSAVIAGHLDQSDGRPSIFYNLDRLQEGDEIGVMNDDGSSITFTVSETKSLDYAADASDVFSLNDGKARLNLVTCGGAWDEKNKIYTKRLVVFAEV